MKSLSRFCLVFSVWLGLVGVGSAQERMIEPYLLQGKIGAARSAVSEALVQHPSDDNLRLQLAITQFLGSVETFSQTMYGFGLDPSAAGSSIPFLRFPVKANPRPRPVTNQDVRAALTSLLHGLTETSNTLAKIDDSATVKVPVRIGLIRMDLDGNGLASPQETLWSVYSKLNPNSGWSEARARQFGARFDTADVRWLEGYTHVLSAMIELTLTYDTQKLWDHSAHLFFAKPTTVFAFLKRSSDQDTFSLDKIVDWVSFVHLINLPVADATHAQLALGHLEQVSSLSRRSWTLILAETDNDYEWIPNPRQKSVIPNLDVTPAMVTGWQEFLNEYDHILAGRVLLPFWREDAKQRGVNLRRILTEPTPFDLVLWVQGTAAVPYLEQGKITPENFWNHLGQAFGGRFFGFAAWFN